MWLAASDSPVRYSQTIHPYEKISTEGNDVTAEVEGGLKKEYRTYAGPKSASLSRGKPSYCGSWSGAVNGLYIYD